MVDKTRDPKHRVESVCDGCGQLDSHPKHHSGNPDGTVTSLHFDCCNCNDCTEKLASGKRHEALSDQQYKAFLAANKGR